MTIQEAIEARHSVRAYKDQPLADEVARRLEEEIAVVNQKGNLHVQLIRNEPKAFQGTMAKYGKFRNANNYIVMAGKKAEDLDERVGYYGEHLVLLAQTLGLNTCWVGLSYSKVPGTYVLDEGEKIACYIAIGYGETQGAGHKIKTVGQVSNASDATPSWFRKGVDLRLELEKSTMSGYKKYAKQINRNLYDILPHEIFNYPHISFILSYNNWAKYAHTCSTHGSWW